MACHNGLTTPAGEDVSIGVSWRASMMANSSRDPYWQAAVRREMIDHPRAPHAIEDECAICHMPMAHLHGARRRRATARSSRTCRSAPAPTDERSRSPPTACRARCATRSAPERLGTPRELHRRLRHRRRQAPDGAARCSARSRSTPAGRRSCTRRPASTPAEADAHPAVGAVRDLPHAVSRSALGAEGRGRSAGSPSRCRTSSGSTARSATERSCQSCHMPAVAEPTPIASVLGEPRERLARHTFLGGNFFMLRMLNRYRSELGVEALAAGARGRRRARPIAHLRDRHGDGRDRRAPTRPAAGCDVDVIVRNLTGHKLPTGYPSRRAWLHVTVRDARRPGASSSRAPSTPTGAIARQRQRRRRRARSSRTTTRSAAPTRCRSTSRSWRDVDGDVDDRPAARRRGYVKDNRLLPRGFDKATAAPDIAVHGGAARDADFTGGGDRVRYVVPRRRRSGPVHGRRRAALPADLRSGGPRTCARYDAAGAEAVRLLLRLHVRFVVDCSGSRGGSLTNPGSLTGRNGARISLTQARLAMRHVLLIVVLLGAVSQASTPHRSLQRLDLKLRR